MGVIINTDAPKQIKRKTVTFTIIDTSGNGIIMPLSDGVIVSVYAIAYRITPFVYADQKWYGHCTDAVGTNIAINTSVTAVVCYI